MRPSSSPSDALLGPFFGVRRVDAEAVATRRCCGRCSTASAALAEAGADAGLMPPDAASAIADVCRTLEVDPARLDQEAGNPVVPLVRLLGERLPGDARPWLHHGATSQDVLDTASCCASGEHWPTARDRRTGRVRGAGPGAPAHADAGRTLGQQAGPTTFGLKAAGWLTGLVQARDAAVRPRTCRSSSAVPPGRWPRSATPVPRWPRAFARRSRARVAGRPVAHRTGSRCSPWHRRSPAWSLPAARSPWTSRCWRRPRSAR